MQRYLALYLVTLSFLVSVSTKARANEETFFTIDFPGPTPTIAIGNNPRGDIVGNYTLAGDALRGFLLRRGHFTPIDVPGAIATTCFMINPGGDIVGRYISPNGRFHGYRLS